MRIRISGPVIITAARSEEPVTDPERLRALDGLVYASEKISDYFGGGATPLMWAANRGSLPLGKLLLERGADPNAQAHEQDNEGHTPLMYVQATSLEVAAYLLEHGADPMIRTQAGETASEVAARNTHQRGWRDLVALYQAAEQSGKIQ